MINYSPLPQRVRRIGKVYDYCIESMVMNNPPFVLVQLKEGYKSGGFSVTQTTDMEALISFLKAVTKPSTRDIKVALYGFECMCGRRVSKGSNYTSLGGLNLCGKCV